MKVLHLFSNYKWTGPAEPALSLCLALRKLGVEADFACGRAPGHVDNRIITEARARGLEPIQSMHLRKHPQPLKNFLDRRRLEKLLNSTKYDLVHCHLNNDHRIAARITTRRGIPLVRSSYYGEGFPHLGRAKALLKHPVFMIEPSRLAMEHDVQTLGVARERATVIAGAIDTGRFDPSRKLADARAKLGIPPDAFVAGIVARMQEHRHYEDLWEAAERLAKEFLNFHVLVVGRGTKQESVGTNPVRERGLSERVHFSGFVSGDDFVATLGAFDVKVFLVPGTDGTCRAVREAMAMGKPAIVARRGMLPEIVDDGINGIVFDNSAEALYEALRPLVRDRGRINVMGKAARSKAETEFALEGQAKRLMGIYSELLGGHR